MFLDHALSVLQSNGQKVTKTRRRLLSKLQDIQSPLNPYELLAKDPNATIDITTIYRNLELFEQLGLVHKIASLGGYIPCTYNHINCNHVHDIIICNSCQHITETHLDIDAKKLLGLGAGPVELNGQCYSCEEKQKQQNAHHYII